MIADDAPEVHGDDLVDSLRLSIRLGVEGGAQPQLDAGAAEQVTPNVTGEHRITVTNYGVRKPM